MKRTRKPESSLVQQMKARVESNFRRKKPAEYVGNTEKMISTGSTLLDLAISGGRVEGGGIPGGIMVEIFGPASSGKTVLLCEIAGAVQRQGGEVMFHDPEARLNKQFAKIFDLDVNELIEKGNYGTPDTIPDVFKAVREWPGWEGAKEIRKIKEIKPPSKERLGINPPPIIHGIFADSLAALSTDLEMEKGDKMGGRRGKEFSEELRKTCRILAKNNYLLVCSNQLRQNMGEGDFAPKYKSPGGEAIGFYSSLRLRTVFSVQPQKIKQIIKIEGKEIERVLGINVMIEVHKNSVWKPYRTAPLTILFNYGIDDIRQNLQFIKNYTKTTTYALEGKSLNNSLELSIQAIEEGRLESELKQETIELWKYIEKKFESNRMQKRR